MEHGAGEQLVNMAVSEVGRAAKNVVQEVENQNSDMDKEMQKQMKEMEHIIKQTAKVAQVVTAGWGKDGAERTKEWNVDC